mmetsp:Transcript_28412/g.79956  ORF Transcript_28412/g.79956 Transcript_28412/m.79956 type:complete len:466 (+) Transcript_28412:230-1627(+)
MGSCQSVSSATHRNQVAPTAPPARSPPMPAAADDNDTNATIAELCETVADDEARMESVVKAIAVRARSHPHEARQRNAYNDLPLHTICSSFVLLSAIDDPSVIGETVSELIKANPEGCAMLGGNEDTPLHLACEYMPVEVARIVLDADRDRGIVSRMTRNGNLALHNASCRYVGTRGSEWLHLVAELLLIHPHGSTVVNDIGTTPLLFATNWEHSRSILESNMSNSTLADAAEIMEKHYHLAIVTLLCTQYAAQKSARGGTAKGKQKAASKSKSTRTSSTSTTNAAATTSSSSSTTTNAVATDAIKTKQKQSPTSQYEALKTIMKKFLSAIDDGNAARTLEIPGILFALAKYGIQCSVPYPIAKMILMRHQSQLLQYDPSNGMFPAQYFDRVKDLSEHGPKLSQDFNELHNSMIYMALKNRPCAYALAESSSNHDNDNQNDQVIIKNSGNNQIKNVDDNNNNNNN